MENNYFLIWSEEFDYLGIPNQNKWRYDVGGGGWGNAELQYYTKERIDNSEVRDGKLYIRAIKENYKLNKFTSAKIMTHDSWKYGRIEIRAKLPMGCGTWPAIWLMPKSFNGINWPLCGEIDFVEHFGHTPGIIESSLHSLQYNFCGINKFNEKVNLHDRANQFNIYTMDWSKDKISFSINNQEFFSAKREDCIIGDRREWPYDEPYYLIINLAVGGNHAGKFGIDLDNFPQELVIDYVRIYQLNSTGG